MKQERLALMAAITLLALALAGCATPAGDPAVYGAATGGTLKAGEIHQAGSSTVYPLAEVWAADFGKNRDVAFSVGGGGSGAGATKLCEKEVDLGDLSRPIKASEKDKCRANGVDPVEWTVAYDGLSVVVSNKNTFVKDVTVEQLVHLFQAEGHATDWDQVDESFPSKPVHLCYPDEDSGTYDYFVEEILDEQEPRTGDGVQQHADDNFLVNCLANDDAAIGFFGFAYLKANENKIHAVKVNGVEPTFQTIADGSYTPLSRPIFIYTDGVPKDNILSDYLRYVYHPEGGQAFIEQVGYVALDDGKVRDMLAQLGRTG